MIDSLNPFGQASRPLTGFSFRVDFGIPGLFTKDVGFQKVSGIGVELALKQVKVGGVDGKMVDVPDGRKFSDLVLERGMITGSYLINWFEAQLVSQVKVPIPVIVTMMDTDRSPIYSWFFINAYPIAWSTDGFDAQNASLIIEKITFRYAFYKQMNLTLF